MINEVKGAFDDEKLEKVIKLNEINNEYEYKLDENKIKTYEKDIKNMNKMEKILNFDKFNKNLIGNILNYGELNDYYMVKCYTPPLIHYFNNW